MAPDFTLADLDGGVFRLSDHRGSVVLIDFMATWCGPCRASMPGLKALHEELGDRVVLISISVDPTHDTEPLLKDWKEGYEAGWIHARDLADPPVSQLYKVRGVPTLVFVGKQGKIRYTHVGLTSEETLREELLTLLGE